MMMGPAPMIKMLFRSVRFGICLGLLWSNSRSRSTFHSQRSTLDGAARELFGCIQTGQALIDQHHETAEQRAHLVRARARFRMTLEAEGRAIGALDALQRAIE